VAVSSVRTRDIRIWSCLCSIGMGTAIVAAVAGFGFSGGAVAAAVVGAVLLVAVNVVWPRAMLLAAAVLAFVVLYAVHADPREPIFRWVPGLFGGGLVALLAAERVDALRMQPLRGYRPPGATPWLVGGAIALLAVALGSLALGASFDLPPYGGGAELTRAGDAGDAAAVDSTLMPYVGLGDGLDSASRGVLGDEVVLRVEASAPDFWRGQSFDHWDGRRWTSSNVETTKAGTLGVHRELVEQTVRVEAAAIGVVFGAYQAVYADVPAKWSYTREVGDSLRLDRLLGSGSIYTVASLRPVVTEDVLRDRDPRAPGAGGAARMSPDPGKPASEEAAALARRVTAGSPTTLDAIRDLESWLADHTTYSTDVPQLRPGADTVDQFLFEDRKGSCVQIASSMTVMLRSLGVPARLGVGFTAGDESLFGREYTVRADDAHAWTEVWFPGVGWQAFDPTADVPLSGDYDSSLLARLGRAAERLVWVFVGIAVLVLLFALWRIARRVWAYYRLPWSTRMYRRIERVGRRRGRPRAPHETPQQYLEALGRSAVPHPEELAVVAEVITGAAYAPMGPGPAEHARAESALTTALRASPAPRPGSVRSRSRPPGPARAHGRRAPRARSRSRR
jgi:transglutaminase-like putative cysteine protease